MKDVLGNVSIAMHVRVTWRKIYKEEDTDFSAYIRGLSNADLVIIRTAGDGLFRFDQDAFRIIMCEYERRGIPFLP